MTAIDELVPQLLGDDPHSLTSAVRQWLVTSRRFRTFAESYQTKIRAKLRTAGDEDALHDLLFELTVARWLLQEKRLQLAYEQRPVRMAPGPDFTVTFTTKTSFHVEVTRIRAVSPVEHDATSPSHLYPNKLLQVILGKLMQVKTGATNLLLIGLAPEVATDVNLDGLMKQMKQRIEGNDATWLARSRLRTPDEFFKHYYALSSILLYVFVTPTAKIATPTAPLLWLNKDAKHPLLSQVQMRLQQLPLIG
jgi:hypothetical protein